LHAKPAFFKILSLILVSVAIEYATVLRLMNVMPYLE